MANATVGAASRLALVGAGYAIAGPVGGLVGNFVGNLFFGGQDIEGPRLDDLEVSSSAYGTFIPRGWALPKIAGTVIWATDLEEEKRTEKQGDFLGAGGTKVTTYHYFANIAVAFGHGPAVSIPRLWAGDKLLIDRGTVEVGQTTDDFVGKIAALASGYFSTRIRVHLGGEDEEPDPLIARKVLEETGEADAVPAHRGLVYVVIERLPLEDFGNRIPPIVAEVNWGGQEEQPSSELTLLQGQELTGISKERAAVDWHRLRAYMAGTGTGVTGIRRMQLDDMVEDFQAVGTEVLPWAVTRDGLLVASEDVLSNTAAYFLYDGESLEELDSFGFSGSGLGNTRQRFQTPRRVAYASMIDFWGTRRDLVLQVGINGAIGLLEVAAQQIEVLWTGEDPDQLLLGTDPQVAAGGDRGDGSGADLWWASHASGSVRVLYVSANNAARMIVQSDGSKFTWGLEQSTYDITPGEVRSGAASLTLFDAIHAPDLGAVVLTVQTDIGTRHLLVCDPSGLVRVVDVNVPAFRLTDQSQILGNELALQSLTLVEVYDLENGIVSYSASWPTIGSGGFTYYHSGSDSLLASGTQTSPVRREFLRRASNEVQLSEVVEELCEDAGLSASEIDASELTDSVRGFVLANQVSYRKVLELLSAVYLFDAAESDFQLKFKKRGRAPVRTINEDDLVPIGEDGETFVEVRSQEVELPHRVSVTYRDAERDSDRAVQTVQRVAAPDRTMHSRHEVSLELPITLTAEEAKGVAQSITHSSWIERLSQQIAADWSHIDLDPGDVVQILRNDGRLLTVRVVRADLGANLEIRLETVREQASSYTNFAVSDGGLLYRRFSVPGSPESRLAMMDMPLLEDTHDNGRRSLQLYWSAGGLGLGTWPGGELWFSLDGASFAFVDSLFEEMTWGVLVEPLGDTDLPFQTDRDNTVEVLLRTGSLSGVTELEMLQGANRAALVQRDGSVEIIHFRDAAQDPDVARRYTLSTLLRGRRGTEGFTGGNAAGTLFVLLSEAPERVSQPLSALGEDRTWTFLARGSRVGDASRTTQALEGRDLRPYAPVHHAASGGPLGTADVTLSWVRRTRVSGDLQDGVGTVALSEDTEEYELEIRPQSDGPVMRTVTGIISPSYLYEVADHSDFTSFHQVELVNPGAEAGDLTGWTEGNVSDFQASEVAAFGGITPRSGNWLFEAPVAQNTRRLGQRYDASGWSNAIDAGNAEARGACWITSSGSDDGRVTLEFLDEADASLGTVTPAFTTVASPGVYQQVTASGPIPVGTRTVVLYIEGQRDGINVDVQFDDATLEIKPGLLSGFAFTVYQISAQVGRGFPGTDDVEPS